MPNTFVEINGVQHPAVIVAAYPLEMGSGNPLGGQTVTTPPAVTAPHMSVVYAGGDGCGCTVGWSYVGWITVRLTLRRQHRVIFCAVLVQIVGYAYGIGKAEKSQTPSVYLLPTVGAPVAFSQH